MGRHPPHRAAGASARHRRPEARRLRRRPDPGGPVHAGRHRPGGAARARAAAAGGGGRTMTSALAADRPPVLQTAAVLLRAEGLCKSFGGVHAVRDISLAVPAGMIFAIIGPNGAGKSTLLNLLSGIYRPDAGRQVLDGVDLTGVPAHRRVRHGIARTFQKIRLFRQLSALDNVVAGFHVHGDIPAWQYVLHGPAFRRNQAHCRREAERLLAFMGLEKRVHELAGSLSYGAQRMLEIARALATAPRLLMVADRVLVIDYGQSLFEGAPADVQTHAAVIAAYLGGEVR